MSTLKGNIVKGIQYNIKQRMKALDMSIPDMETKAGVGRNVLGNFVSGARENPTLETLTRIAEVLECSVAELFKINTTNEDQSKLNADFLKWNELLFHSCVNTVIKIVNELSTNNSSFQNKILDTNKIIFIINQVYKYSLKGSPDNLVANEKFAEFLIENNFPSL